MERGKHRLEEILVQGILPLCIYYLVNQCVLILGMLCLEAYLQKTGGHSINEMYLRTILQMAGMFAAACFVSSFYKREENYEKYQDQGQEKKKLSVVAVMGIIFLGAIFSLGINFLFSAVGFTQSSESYNQVARRQFSLPLGLALAYYGILSPWAEELVFRGILYRVLRRNMSAITAVLGSGLLFGAFHGNMIQLVYGTIMGSGMALLYGKYNNLMAPILFHGAANVAIYVVTYFF